MLKRTFYAIITSLTAFACTCAVADDAATTTTAAPAAAATDLDPKEMLKVSEAFGHFIGRNLNAPGIKFDLESIIKGMREGAAGKPAPMTDQEYEAAMTKLQERAFSQLSTDNLKEANTFMADNAKKDKIVVIEPGKLQYTILEEGTGTPVTEHARPLVTYSGKYADGTVFGSSEQVGGPITIPLDQTIPGFSKGIVGMKEGEKRRLFVHPDLGYGTSGHLPPNKLLIFDVQVVKADSPQKGAMMDDDIEMNMAESDEDGEDDRQAS